MKEYFGTPHVREMAPWISILIDLFRERQNVDLHIVAPNVFSNNDCDFERDGIKYHFYKIVPLPYNFAPFRKLYTLFRIDDRTNFYWVKRKIMNCISKINPDIIHLHGAENPYYSAGILPLLNKYPTITTIQGFIRNSSNITSQIKNKIYVEEAILRNSKNVGIRTDEMSKIALQLNPNAILHFHNYPIEIPIDSKINIGKNEPIDCLFFARVCKDKGIEDLLRAISIVKRAYPNVSLSVIGGSSNSYFSYLRALCAELDIQNNVQFIGFLASQKDIYKYALNAKICVLPTYHDIIPGTIIESMFLKLPVIAYAVGGIPELNRDEETVILIEKFNIKQLADKIKQLLADADLRKNLSDKAHVLVQVKFNNRNIAGEILDIYKTILD